MVISERGPEPIYVYKKIIWFHTHPTHPQTHPYITLLTLVMKSITQLT